MKLARYVAIRAVGLGLFTLSFLGLVVLSIAVTVSGPSLVWLVALGLGFFCAIVSSPLAFLRRAQVGETSFIPPFLPLAHRFLSGTTPLSLAEVSEVYNVMAGGRLVGITFETRDGRKYLVLRGVVGKEVFERFLELKRRFYGPKQDV